MTGTVEYANHIFYGENLNTSDLNVKYIINTDISETDIDTINDISARIALCDDMQKTFIVSYMLRRSDKMLCVVEPYRSIIKTKCGDIVKQIAKTARSMHNEEYVRLYDCITNYLKTVIITSTATTIS